MFFQQKRAFDMRISDSSSDVCSADRFLYGKDTRSTSLDTIGTVQRFAGRVFPVTDFGEHEDEEISVSVDIPHGPTHRTEEADLRTFMEMKKTLYLRDNRGRATYGTMSGFNQADQAWGVSVGFKRSEEHTSELQSIMRTTYAVS